MKQLKLILFSLLLLGTVQAAGLSAQPGTVLTGVLSTTFADHPDHPYIVYQLTTLDGRRFPLSVDEAVLQVAGGLLALNGQAVSVELNAPPSVNAAQAGEALSVRSLSRTVLPGAALSGGSSVATTSQAWLNLLCKFSDIATEYHTQAQVNALFGNTYPLMDHYFREASYNQISVASPTTMNWVNLPHPLSYYFVAGSTLNLTSLLTDCVTAYGSAITANNFYGINLFINGDLGGYFYGSSCQYVNLQGTTRCWRTTWLPTTWSSGFYQDVIAHEMGHAMGLLHSNNSDGDSNPYDNFYDLMSGHACGVYLANYSCIGQHIISAYKDQLGWLAPGQKFTLSSAGTYTITIDRLAMSNPANYYAAFIPIDGTHFFTVEARRNTDNDYDKTLSDSGIIIHEEVTTRNEPAWLVNGVSDEASRTGPGVWVPGETYTNYTYGFSVTVNSTTTDGYSVTLKKGGLPATQPDLSVTLQDATSQPNEAVFLASVSNTGTGTATGVTLVMSTTYNVSSLTSDPALTCDNNMCVLGDLGAGETRNYTLHMHVASGGSTGVQLVGALNETDPTPANNTASVTTNVTVAPDIRVTITHDADIVDVSDTIVNHVRAENVGGAAATGVTLTVPLPSGVSNGGYGWGYLGSGVNCQLSGSTFTCTDATMNPNNYVYLDIYSYPQSNGSYDFTASATLTNTDANPADNSASLTTIVGTPVGLQAKVTLQGRPAAPNARLVVPLTVVVTPNGGGAPVLNTTVTTDDHGMFSLTGLADGTYRFWVKHSHSLAVAATVTLPTGNIADLGALPEGDADGNNLVNLTDFSLLAASFGKQTGNPGFDARADFNGDGTVNLTDFSLLATNFGTSGAAQ